MVARAVMKAWKEGLGGPPPMGRIHRSEIAAHPDRPADAEPWQSVDDDEARPPVDDRDDDPEIRIAKREDFVPRRPGAANGATSDESFWSSHQFWKGIVVGAAIVLLLKTVMAVHAPFGIDWYSF